MQTKYIFVTGGVVSGLGKGIAAASLGRLLKQRGLRVKVQKLDPYLNVDPGTMSPYQHGEVFVTDDGAETDLDLGHYERFIDENLTGASSVSSGKIYWNVLNRERAGDYLGGTVQIIPHITGEIKDHIYALEGPDTDVAIVEIGVPHRVHPGQRGAEKQAHPALGEGAAGAGDSTGCNLMPQRLPSVAGNFGENLPVLQHPRGPRHSQPDGGHPL